MSAVPRTPHLAHPDQYATQKGILHPPECSWIARTPLSQGPIPFLAREVLDRPARTRCEERSLRPRLAAQPLDNPWPPSQPMQTSVNGSIGSPDLPAIQHPTWPSPPRTHDAQRRVGHQRVRIAGVARSCPIPSFQEPSAYFHQGTAQQRIGSASPDSHVPQFGVASNRHHGISDAEEHERGHPCRAR